MKKLIWLAALAAMIGACSAKALEVVDAVVYTTQGEVPLKLELAATPETREHGLMKRDTLSPNDGMLFLFPTAEDYAFWMKDTRIPLDMLFINAAHEVVHIEVAAKPFSTRSRSSGKDIVAVIELDGGRAGRESIVEGDRVRYDLPPALEVR